LEQPGEKLSSQKKTGKKASARGIDLKGSRGIGLWGREDGGKKPSRGGPGLPGAAYTRFAEQKGGQIRKWALKPH